MLFREDIEATDPAYINIRAADSTPAKTARDCTNSLWADYEPYADRHFSSEIAKAFDERFWEMYLTCTLLDLGLAISCPKPGPDVLVGLDRQRVWFEAICPTQGSSENPDRVPDYVYGATVATRVPEEKLLMRLRHAIETKFRVQERYLQQGIVSTEDAYVVAINACQLPHAAADRDPPRITRCVFPIGNLEVLFNRENPESTETRFAYRREVERQSGAEISTDIFLQDEYRRISGVLYSSVDAGNPTWSLGDDFVFVHNPLAINPVPLGILKRGREVQAIEDGKLYSLKIDQW